MKTKTYYLADDGAECTSKSSARARNRLLKEIDAAMSPLGPPVKDRACRFANGGGYRQHAIADVMKAKRAFIKIAKREVPDKIWNHPAEKIHPLSWAGRLLDDCSPTLYQAWCRFGCIDNKGREWGQAYYALNPDKGQQTEWI
ncbi:MAG TPA: hypothetical protein VLA89_06695 [Gemmatimonadales bacterium]|nr:hypothetical protein [Gemmatimonadales bacterium]